MDILECIKTRRSISVYKDTPVEEEVLLKILELLDGHLRGQTLSLSST
ncbi:MAG: hypothetical protein GX076_06915 [Clostridiales bacterium]|nr:hypothetical protein [Clostridiales bacterium]